MNFQKLLDQYKGELVFHRLVTTTELSPDQYLYRIETNDGHYYVLEIDFIEDFAEVTGIITSTIGGYKYFIEVKNPPKTFEETGPYKKATEYKTPKDFEEFKKYVNDKYASFDGYFNFLIKV